MTAKWLPSSVTPLTRWPVSTPPGSGPTRCGARSRPSSAGSTSCGVTTQERTAPGSGTWADVVGTKPTVIIIDEIAGHLRQLASSGSEDVRRQAAAVPAALKSLFELAASIPNLVVIVTLATHSDAYGKETNDIEDLLNETEGAFQDAMVDAKSVLARTESVIKPAEDTEIAQILKTRLFESIDPAGASAASAAYRSFYEELVEKGVSLPGGADQPTAYGEQVESSYPFHPELIRVLDKRLGTIPNFQRARGALKLLAEVIVGIWGSGKETEIINVADIDLEADPVLTHLTVGLGRDEYENVAKVDIIGSASHAATGRPAAVLRIPTTPLGRRRPSSSTRSNSWPRREPIGATT